MLELTVESFIHADDDYYVRYGQVVFPFKVHRA
jgi:hypothetical protein